MREDHGWMPNRPTEEYLSKKNQAKTKQKTGSWGTIILVTEYTTIFSTVTYKVGGKKVWDSTRIDI